MALNFIDYLVKRVRQLASHLREKPSVKVEDFVLEHFLFYHGLVGSTPENQREFRDIRADFLAAVKDRSSVEMSIVLKLQPLWWEDKLKAIASEVKDSERPALISSLVPDDPDGMLAPNQDPLRNDDWRVRANAAMLLAYIKANQSVEKIAAALTDTTDSTKAAFCHLAYALAGIRTESARAVLEKYIFDDEPWFRVDALGALAHWPFAAVAETLAEGLLAPNPFSDYAAVAIARHHKPMAFLSDSRASVKNGGCAMVLALIAAFQQTFSLETVIDAGITETVPRLRELAMEQQSGLRLSAVLGLVEWLIENRTDLEAYLSRIEETNGDAQFLTDDELQSIRKDFSGGEVQDKISSLLQSHNWEDLPKQSSKDLEGYCLIELAGRFKAPSAAAVLNKFLHVNSPFLDAAIDATGEIGLKESASLLVSLASQLVNVAERSSRVPSSQPVIETEPEKTQSYWHILRALGKIPSRDALPLLFEAAKDYAPDKREQALSSLTSLSRIIDLGDEMRKSYISLLALSLHDSSAQVRLRALEGVAGSQEPQLISDALALVDAREVSVSKGALKALTTLAEKGHKEQVIDAVRRRLNTVADPHKRRRLNDFLSTL
ncbi:MAG TPA: HEAT repeat domain-containing protein [Candidatus Obscuribacterales bacterium]